MAMKESGQQTMSVFPQYRNRERTGCYLHRNMALVQREKGLHARSLSVPWEAEESFAESLSILGKMLTGST